MDEEKRHRPDTTHEQREARDWLVHLTSGNVDETDLDAFRQWQAASPRHAAAFERERTFWGAMAVADHATANQSPVSRRRGPTRRRVLAGGIAAGIGAAAAGLRLDLLWRADFITAVGESRRVALPDGTPMLMNTDTAVALEFEDASRRVRLLRGEAQFEIAGGGTSPFEVAARGGTVATDAASFAIRLRGRNATVTVAAGESKIRPDANGSLDEPYVLVAAGEQASYGKSGPVSRPMPIDVEQALAWRDGRIILDGIAFADAVTEIGRYLPERLVVTDSSHDAEAVSGVFSTARPVAALEAVAAVRGLTTRRVPGLLILIS